MKKGRLILMGAGIHFPHDLSLRTLEWVKRCDTVFLHPVCKNLEALFKSHCRSVQTLKASQEIHSSDSLWRSFFWKFVGPRLAEGETVGYMSYGHPLLMADGYLILRQAEKKGYSCTSIPSSSAIDSILSAMSFKPEILTEVFMVANATHMARTELLNPRIPTILFCLTNIGKIFPRISGLIGKKYGAQHPVYIVRCGDRANVFQVKVFELESLEESFPSGASLVIPAKPLHRKSSV